MYATVEGQQIKVGDYVCFKSDVELDADGEVVISEAMDPAYEDDGQPSEMEEWHSFDPDC